MKLFLNDSNHQNLTERIKSSKSIQKSDDNTAYYNQYCNKFKNDKKNVFKEATTNNIIKKTKVNLIKKNHKRKYKKNNSKRRNIF